MSRKKLNSFLALLLLLVYLICFGISWSACVSYVHHDFYFTINSFRDSYNITLNDLMDGASYNSTKDYTFKNSSCFDWLASEISSGYMEYPFSMVVFDESGNIISKSDVMISVQKGNEIQIINLGDYLTDDTRKELIDILNDEKIYELRAVDCFEKDGKAIPVKLHFITYSDNCDKEKSLSITTNEVTSTYDENEYDKLDYYNEDPPTIVELCSYNLLSSKTDKSVCDKLFKDNCSDEMKARALEYFKNTSGGGGGYYGVDTATRFDNIELDGNRYFVYYQIDYNLADKVVTSNVFKTLFNSQLIIFAIITVLSFVIANKLFTKNKNMVDAKNAFISAAAHELKTPLAAIQNNSECIIENVNPEKNDRYISTVHNESLRMGELLSKLLQYNRLATSAEVKKSHCSLTDIVKRELMQYEPLFDEKGMTVEENIEDNVSLNANENLISLAVDNLLSNALKYSSDNALVTVTLENKNGVHFTVFNQCSGIDCDDKEKLWDVLYRTDKVRNSTDEASGLGLAICKQIFEIHKLKYGFNNVENGVEFYFKEK